MLFKLDEILAGSNTSNRVQVAKVGTFDHEIYGRFSISDNDLARMKFHLDNNSRRQEMDGVPVLPFDYFHEEERIAAGWIKSLEIDLDRNGIHSLFAVVEWTPNGAQKIKDKELKFVSPSIRKNYKDAETGELFDVILKGATLTNTPFLRDMEAVYLFSEDKQKAFKSLKLTGDGQIINEVNMKLSEIQAAVAALSPEDKKKLFDPMAAETKIKTVELTEQLTKAEDALKLSEKTLGELKEKMTGSTDISDKLKLSEQTITDLSGKVSSLTNKLAENEKKAEFDVKLSEGKVCEAQREAFMKNDIAKFMENAQEIKLAETGSKDNKDPENNDSKIDKMAIALQEKDKDLDYGDAVSIVLSENPGLRN